jgi:hypothetical protein
MRRRETQCTEEEKNRAEKEKKKRWRRVPSYLLLAFFGELARGQGPPWSPCNSVPGCIYSIMLNVQQQKQNGILTLTFFCKF